MATLVVDDFDGSAGNLAGTTADTGGTWGKASSFSGNLVLNGSGDVDAGSNGVWSACYLNSVGSASTDQTIIQTVRRGGDGFPWSECGGVICCSDDGNTHYRWWTNGTSWRISKRVSGSDTQLAQHNLTHFNNERYRIKFERVGDTLKLYTQLLGADSDFVLRLTVDESENNPINTAGKAGLWGVSLGGAFSAPGLHHIEDFQLDGTGAGGGPTVHQQAFSASSANAGDFPVLARTTGEGFDAASLNAGVWSPVKIPGSGGGQPTLHQQMFSAASMNAGVWAAMLRANWDPTPLPPSGRRGPKHRQRKQRGSHS